MNDPSARVPDLYQLLGLSALESDRQKIASAIKQLGRLAPQPSAQDGERGIAGVQSAEELRLQKIAALAQKYLLDPQRKTAYDLQWQRVYAPAVQWDMQTLEAWLPSGDPHAAFDMAQFLHAGESRDPMAAESELNRLIALLSHTDAAPRAAPSAPVVEASPLSLETLAGLVSTGSIDTISDLSAASGPGISLASVVGTQPNAAPNAAPSVSLAKRLQKKRQRAMMLGGGLFAAGIAGLAAMGVSLMRAESQRDAAQELALQSPTNVAQKEAPLAARNAGMGKNIAALNGKKAARPPTSSGLPQPGQGDAQLQVDAMPKTDPAMANPAMASSTIPDPAMADPAMASVPAVPATAVVVAPSDAPAAAASASALTPEMIPATPAGTPLSGEPKLGEPAPASTTDPTPTADPVPASVPDAKLTKEDKQAWQSDMKAAKELISKHEFDAAEKQLSAQLSTAKTAVQRAQLERLQEVNGFVREVHEAMVAAIAGLGPADTFKIGTSTHASFIEGDDQKIVVRISGQRHSYALNEMPVAMGVALAELKMDLVNGASMARRGAYIVLHPKAAKKMLASGKQMLSEAAAAGAISAELAKFYDDDYSLAQVAN